MKLKINHLKFPETPFKTEWGFLEEMCKLNNIRTPSLHTDGLKWVISEIVGEIGFYMERDKVTTQRKTLQDPLGCIGFSTLNFNDPRVYLTEGVSDYFTVKLTHPNMNVLGLTTLGGNVYTKVLISTMFNNICIVSDNDFTSEHNTGLINAQRMRKFYEAKKCKVKILLPETGYKDITEQFIADCKFEGYI